MLQKKIGHLTVSAPEFEIDGLSNIDGRSNIDGHSNNVSSQLDSKRSPGRAVKAFALRAHCSLSNKNKRAHRIPNCLINLLNEDLINWAYP
jgi:hypothetical protein